MKRSSRKKVTMKQANKSLKMRLKRGRKKVALLIETLKMNITMLMQIIRCHRAKIKYIIIAIQIFVIFIFMMKTTIYEIDANYARIEEYQEVVEAKKNYMPNSWKLYLTKAKIEATDKDKVVKVIVKSNHIIVEIEFENYEVIDNNEHKIMNYFNNLLITLIKSIIIAVIIDTVIGIAIYLLKTYFDSKKHNC